MIVYFKNSMFKYCVYKDESRKVLIQGFFKTRATAEKFLAVLKEEGIEK